MSIVRCAVLGAGRIGRIHAGNLAKHVEHAELVAVADVDEPAAVELAGRLRVPVATADCTAVLSRDDVDAVVIATPTSTHYDLILEAVAAGKAIFTEKPIDLELVRIDAINAAVAARGVPMMVGFQRRFDPDFARLREVVASGGIGSVHLVRITSRDAVLPHRSFIATSGGLFLDMTVHDLDMVRFVTGREVVGVYARASVLVDPMFAEEGDWDTAVLTLTLEGGALATIDNSRRAVYGQDQRVEVFGSKGAAAAHNHVRDRVAVADASGRHAAPLLPFFPERYAEAYRREMQAFVDALRLGRPMPVTGEDGRRATALAVAAAQSARENRYVAVE
ncbi:MAG: inositol 2-dehydrogenase [Acidobacteriota bacterium]|jgi:myo-inositol 2-dehydrogenase/D-chiro-inositol 1-dehydrogenase|nr:MAG: inositol 2-dehydrogenase [Acidobacteriota bacterium]